MSQRSGPGTPVTNEQRVRYQACINTSNYDAPPFAAMIRDSSDSLGLTTTDGAAVWQVTRCTAVIAAAQRASDVVFAGPEGVRAGKPGRCTEDFPARALHLRSDTLSSKGGLGDGRRYVGPKADSWLLWDSGNAFRWLGTEFSIDDNYQVGLVTPAFPRLVAVTGGLAPTTQDVLTLENLATGLTLGESSDNYNLATAWESELGTNDPCQLCRDGVYDWEFHCTLTSADAVQGESLIIQSYLKNNHTDEEFQLPQFVSRRMQVEIDNYGSEISRSAENVAMCGRIRLDDADAVLPNTLSEWHSLIFKNLSASTVTVTAMFVRLRRIP